MRAEALVGAAANDLPRGHTRAFGELLDDGVMEADTLPRDQAHELAEEHLAVTSTETLGSLVIAPILGALDQRIALDLDAGVLADQAPEGVIHALPREHTECLAGIVPQPL